MTRMTNAQRAMSVLWPAFLMAGVLEMVVFALVDPESLRWFGDAPLDLHPVAVYTLAFFVFWALMAMAGALTLLLCTTGPQSIDDALPPRSAAR